jgi:hypothetical protein
MASDEVLIQAAISSWEQVINRVGTLCFSCSEEQLLVEVAPGKNRISYLWGHLTAVNDCDVQRLAAGRAATPGIGRRLHRATGPIRPASNLHRDCQVLEGRSHRAPFEIQDSQL